MAIVYDILVKHEYQTYVAKKFRVKPVVVSVLVNKAKKKKNFLDELYAKQDEKQSKQ